MRMSPSIPLLTLAATLAFAPVAAGEDMAPDTMTFRPWPAAEDSAGADTHAAVSVRFDSARDDDAWLQAPFGDRLLTHPDPWRARHRDHSQDLTLALDYNRVDLVRYGLWYQAQRPETLLPRIGARFEYATGRRRTLYGVQLEQPLAPPARLVLGVSMVRRTDHSDLQQVDDVENSLALLFARQDYRDYFEREGVGAYVAWRVPDFSTVSVHMRGDQYRSLARARKVTSWFNRSRPLRDNPAVDEGEAHRALLRLERLAHRTERTRAGLYHWIELERAGGSLGGDFDYTRALGDLRSVLRLSPAVTLSLRAVAGSALDGDLPRQARFTAGGVDGLRGHAFSEFVGDQLLLLQAEYTVGLWALESRDFGAGLQAIAFVDAGRAWSDRDGWTLGEQRMAVDGGFGLATAEDDLRVTFAKDLQEPGSDFVVQVRLQRPF
jgi:hypothetical protein